MLTLDLMANREPGPIGELVLEYAEKRKVNFADIAKACEVSRPQVTYLVYGRSDGKTYMGLHGSNPLWWKVVDFLRIPAGKAEQAAAEESLAWAVSIAKRPPKRAAKRAYPKTPSDQRELVVAMG